MQLYVSKSNHIILLHHLINFLQVHQNVLVFYKGDIEAIREIYKNDFVKVDLDNYNGFDYIINNSENLEKEIEALMQEYDWTWRVAKDALENGWY